jgi:hypothetical protein
MAKNARSRISVTCSNRQGGNWVLYNMTRRQCSGCRRRLQFRSEVVIYRIFPNFVTSTLYMCKALRTKCQCYHGCENDELSYDGFFHHISRHGDDRILVSLTGTGRQGWDATLGSNRCWTRQTYITSGLLFKPHRGKTWKEATDSIRRRVAGWR